jgi:hypothetical protein
VLASLAVALQPCPARADVVLQIDTPFAGSPGGANSGSVGYLTATFSNTGPNQVHLTVQSFLAAGDFINGSAGQQGLFFNFGVNNPAPDPSTLSFSNFSLSGSHVQNGPGANQYKADGDGWYDIAFYFDGMVLLGGSSFSVDISGTGISAASFDNASADNNTSPANDSSQPFHAAAHIQGLAGNLGGSVFFGANPGVNPIPEPSTIALALSGLGAVGFVGLRRFRRRVPAVA